MNSNTIARPKNIIKSAVLFIALFAGFQQFLPAKAQVVNEPLTSTFVSEVKKAPMTFTAVGVRWNENKPSNTSASLFVRLQETDTNWTDWQLIEGSIDGFTDEKSHEQMGFIAGNPSTALQYKIILTSANPEVSPIIENIRFTYINARETIQPVSEMQVAAVTTKKTPSKGTSSTPLKVIRRSEWGADESLRLYTGDSVEPELVKLDPDYYDKFKDELQIEKKITTDANGKLLTWPLEYAKNISKIVIHHTATVKNLDDPQKALRDIYYWHTISKGWGDIGYNYIIDQQGNIYEGRYGGEKVVGAHAGKANVGSIGIAMLGNYQENEVPEPVITSLVQLIQNKTSMYGIDPEGKSNFRGEDMSNIIGHRDVMSTACPGEKLYTYLPTIRSLVKKGFKAEVIDKIRQVKGKRDYDYSPITTPQQITFQAGETKTIDFTIKNTGKKSWPSATVLVVNPDEVSNAFFDTSKPLTSKPLGKEVKPGSTAKLSFTLTAKYQSTLGNLKFFPLINNQEMVQKYLSIPSKIEPSKYDYEIVKILVKKSPLKKGETTDAIVTLKNTGSVSWQRTGATKIQLGTLNPKDKKSLITPKPTNRLGTLMQKQVKPGETGTFKVKIKAPNKDGRYLQYFAPVIEKVQWLPDKGASIQIDVGNSTTPVPTTPTTPTKPIPVSKPNSIKIGLSFSGNPVISGDGAFQLLSDGKHMSDFAKDEKVTVSYENEKFQVKADRKAFVLDKPALFKPKDKTILRIDNYENRPDWDKTLNDNQYEGTLEVTWYNNELKVVNDLPLEDYLKGLAEISAKDPVEKIRSVIILARSYAAHYIRDEEKFPGAPYHLTDDPQRSQKYLGYSFRIRNLTGSKAVDDTKDLVVTYKGKLIKTPYFSSSDGRTRSAEEVWGWKDTPYLVSVDDPGCAGKKLAGHGVGLSGCGAAYFANQGKTFKEIIQYYFQGVEVEKLSEIK